MRWVKWPAATLRMMTSRGTISTFFTKVSRSSISCTKWVGTPSFSSFCIRALDSLLFTTPLPRMVPFLLAVTGGGIVLVVDHYRSRGRW